MNTDGFTTDEQTALAAIVAQIIPAPPKYDQPAADDPQIFADILKSYAHLRSEITKALTSVSEPFDAQGAATFRQAFPDAAILIQNITIQCYYRDPRVMRALKIEVRPPFPAGYAQIPNDLTLLEPVRTRGEMYRKPPVREA